MRGTLFQFISYIKCQFDYNLNNSSDARTIPGRYELTSGVSGRGDDRGHRIRCEGPLAIQVFGTSDFYRSNLTQLLTKFGK